MIRVPQHRSYGFSLIELAVFLLIMGSLLTGILATITQTTENTRRTVAKNKLERIAEALYGFAQANGRLPCPATATSDGLESPLGGGVCNQAYGFVPNATLGLYGQINTDGLLRDPWANPYRYSVSTGDRSFTDAATVSTLFDTSVTNNANILQVCDDSACTNTPLSDIVPAVILSMGTNWADTTAECGVAPVPDPNADERANAGAVLDGVYCVTNTITFVSTTYIEDVFDDELLWLSPHVLFSKLISAGQLP